MPTGLTHAAVGLGLAEVFLGPDQPPLVYGLGALLGVLPDIDVIRAACGHPLRLEYPGLSRSASQSHRDFGFTPFAVKPRPTCQAATSLRSSWLGNIRYFALLGARRPTWSSARSCSIPRCWPETWRGGGYSHS